MAGRVPVPKGRLVVAVMPGSVVDVVVDPLVVVAGVVEDVEAGDDVGVVDGVSVEDVDGDVVVDVVGGVTTPGLVGWLDP